MRQEDEKTWLDTFGAIAWAVYLVIGAGILLCNSLFVFNDAIEKQFGITIAPFFSVYQFNIAYAFGALLAWVVGALLMFMLLESVGPYDE